MLSKPARADFVDLLCVMYQSTGGFCTSPAGKRLNRRQAVSLAGIDDASLDEMLEAGVVELVDDCPYCPKVAEVIEDRDRVSEGRSEVGKKGAQRRWQLPSENMANEGHFATEKNGDVESREKKEDRRQKTLSSVLDPQRHPAPAREAAGRRESDSDFWGPKIEAVYHAVHGQAPQAGSREAIAAALRTTRATDLVLAIEGAKRNPWAQQDRRRQTLPGILSPKRRDGHIQDARSFYGWTGDQGEAWAEGMIRSHGGDK